MNTIDNPGKSTPSSILPFPDNQPRNRCDGVDVPVQYHDGRAESVKVRKLPHAEFSMLALVVADESEQAEFAEAALYCGVDIDQARTMHEESLGRVLEEGQRLNFPAFARWFRRRARLTQLLENQSSLIELAAEVQNRLQADQSEGTALKPIQPVTR